VTEGVSTKKHPQALKFPTCCIPVTRISRATIPAQL
jgi:hypothetical protein